jgi:hypothetical protein
VIAETPAERTTLVLPERPTSLDPAEYFPRAAG